MVYFIYVVLIFVFVFARNFSYVNDNGTYPASKLKLYIHDVDAALKTLHHIRWYSLFTRNSQAFGLWSESLPGRSSPSSAHFSARNFRLAIRRCSVSAVVICSNIFSSGVRFASCQNVIKPSICEAKSMQKDVVCNRYFIITQQHSSSTRYFKQFKLSPRLNYRIN